MTLHNFRLPPKEPILSLICTNRRCDFMKAKQDCVGRPESCNGSLDGREGETDFRPGVITDRNQQRN